MSKQTPWERFENEPEAAYKNFLVYLGLGPGRTLLDAWKAINKSFNGVRPEVVQEVPDHVKRMAARWQWEDRAMAHNANVFTTKAITTTYGFIELLDLTIARIREHVENDFAAMSKKMTIPQLIEAINALAKFIPQSAVQQLHDHARNVGLEPGRALESSLCTGPNFVCDGSAENPVHTSAHAGSCAPLGEEAQVDD
jgi:hypothetical protein